MPNKLKEGTFVLTKVKTKKVARDEKQEIYN